jgi:NAD(P)-dependent dehydrogenase (short-subunit alcohol dehydrogenase family)
MSVEIDLTGDVAIVTGAGSSGPGFGTGKAIAILLARAGCNVCVVDNVAERAAETVELIDKEGGNAAAFVGDISKPSECEAVVAAAVSTYGRLTTLVNNVGVFMSADLSELDFGDLDRTLDVNLKAMIYFAKYSLPHLRAAGHGCIINISSISAHRGVTANGSVAYAASKGGIESMTKALAVELAGYRIRVNAVVPGTLRTPLLTHTLSESEIDDRQKLAPLGIGGDAWDVAAATLFLVSSNAKWITGVSLPVDGGMLATTPLASAGRVDAVSLE